MDAVRPASHPIPWPWLGVATALAASLIFCFVSLTRERDRAAVLSAELSRVRSESQQLRAAFAFLQSPETRPVIATPGPQPPRGTYFVNPGGVLLIASHLPALSAEKTYQMWLIPRSGAPLPAGLFRAGASGSAVHFVAQPVDVQQTAAFAISVEPGAGSPAPTTAPLLVTALSAL